MMVSIRNGSAYVVASPAKMQKIYDLLISHPKKNKTTEELAALFAEPAVAE